MTTLSDLDYELARAEETFVEARHTWEQAQADYAAALVRIKEQRTALRTARIAELEAELATLQAEARPALRLTCPHCGHTSPTQRGLTVHIKRKHPEYYTPALKPAPKQTCPTCGQSFARLASHYYMVPACNPGYREAAQRRLEAERAATEAYQRISLADREMSLPFRCQTCQGSSHAESTRHPGVCVRCAVALNGVEVAA